MEELFPILIAVVAIALFGILLLSVLGRKGKKDKSGRKKDRSVILKEANKRLAQNPRDPEGLSIIGDLYFKEHIWDKAMPVYEVLMDLGSARSQVNQGEAALRYGICALKLGRLPDALKGLFHAKQLNPHNFEVNFYLGQVYYLTNDIEKAVPLLKQAEIITPDHLEVQKFLGLSLYKSHKYRDAISYLKKVFDLEPENKELLFTLAECLAETGNNERAIKIFTHMRADPEFGARASLIAGTIHSSQNQPDKAIEDFEIGLKHTNILPEQRIDLQYRLATAHIRKQEISKALFYLKEIQSVLPGYKDVAALIARYQELNQNQNYQIYLISNSSDFIVLCRKIVQGYFKQSRVKILDITMQSDYAEILAEVDTPKWEDTVLFRFYRSTGTIGELFIRDFHSKIRDTRSGRGICITAGSFSDEALKFIDGRPIDLLNKEKLFKILNMIR
jgi:tetratricopeptide (TPR) repeat protein